MAQPTQLTPTEQDALVKQIGLAMLRVAPEDWEQLTVDYRAVGRYAESTGQVTYSDGGTDSWTMPADLQGLFARLRGGMYREGRGTWFNARYKLDHPSSYNLEYDREEPVWELPPPPQAYPDDMRMFPRSDDNVPEWLRRRLAQAPPPGPPPGTPPGPPPPDRAPGPPRFRVARIFDGPGEDGRPSVNRPQVDEMDIQDILDYLDNGPLVGPARGYDVDRLDPNGQQSVPVAFHTDGTWIWPAAVNYFLREHDIAPEPDLVEHIRRMRFQLPQVDDQTRAAAQQFLGPPPPGPRPGPPPGQPPAPAPTRAMPVPAPAPVPAPPPVPAPAPAPMTPPRAALPSQGPASAEIDHLRARLEDLDVPETAYRVGPPTGRGWTMEQTDDGWRVGWHDQDWVAPAMFEDVADASAFLLGKLLLDTDRWAAGPKNPELPSAPAAEDHGFEPMAAPVEDYARNGGGRRTAGRDSFTPPPAGSDFGGGRDAFTPPANDEFGGAAFTPPGDFGGRDAYTPAAGRDEFGGREDAGHDTFTPASGRDEFGGGTFAADGFTPPGGDFGGRDDLGAGRDAFTPAAGRDDAGRDSFTPPPAGSDFGGGRDAFTPAADAGRDGFTPPPGGSDFGGGDFGGGDFGGGRDEFGGRDDTFTPAAGRDEFGGRDSFTPQAGRDDAGPGRGEFGTRIVGPPPGTPGFTSPSGPVGPPPGTPGFTPPPGTPPRGEQATVLARPANGAAAAPPGAEWPITPLPGEPPLTLFRGKRMVELEPGTEIDRFGDDDGNLAYAVGTPFTERSLVPEWIDRPYHVYRVRQPVQVLTGAAIPWFDQPGGGTAYLLPDAIGDLVAHGHLVEVDSGDAPRS